MKTFVYKTLFAPQNSVSRRLLYSLETLAGNEEARRRKPQSLRWGRLLLFLSLFHFSFAVAMQNSLAPAREAASLPVKQRDFGVNFFEVSASKLETAKFWLKNKAKLAISKEDIFFLGQKNFSCSEGETPYLVLANYENGGTGNFRIEKSEKSIIISYSSLGQSSSIFQTALVICIDFEPVQVISKISGAQ